jgi:transportin-3
VDDSTYNDEGRVIDLPDGLVHFRMNLVELLVDICHLLGSTIFMQKVILESFIFFPGMFYTFYYGIITLVLLVVK